MSAASLTRRIKELAYDLGFDVVGVTSVDPLPEAEARLLRAIGEGRLAPLPWLTPERARRSCRPAELVPGARSILSVAISYLAQAPTTPASEPTGRIARYAWGADYHGVLRLRLGELVQALQRQLGRQILARAFVDTGPLAERAVAHRAGLGWFGKNTALLHDRLGSWFVLGEIVWDLPLEPDAPGSEDCGPCDLCLQACPTGALVAPHTLEVGRCLSYLTIENRGPIPRELRPLVGNCLFGCDACQEACPINQRANPAHHPEFEPRFGPHMPLLSLLRMSEEEFRARFAASAIARARRRGLVRNALVVLGNLGDRAVVPAVAARLEEPDALLRSHAAWALGQLGQPVARAALERALAWEADPQVREEIAAAVNGQ